MAHLSVSEQHHGFEALFIALYGEDNYMRWQQLKTEMNFASEQNFITWILNYIESTRQQINDSLDGDGNTYSSQYESEQGIFDNSTQMSSAAKPQFMKGKPSSYTTSEAFDVVKVEVDLTSDDEITQEAVESNPAQSVGQDKTEIKIKNAKSILQSSGDGGVVHCFPLRYSDEKWEHSDGDAYNDVSMRPAAECAYEDSWPPQQRQDVAGGAELSPAAAASAGSGSGSDGTGGSTCPECGKTFSMKCNLSAHVRTAHLGVRYPCHMCQQSFTSRQNRRFHLIKKHKYDFLSTAPPMGVSSALQDSQYTE